MHENIEPEILYFLACDKDPLVRLKIAYTDGTPLQANMILAKDSDEVVRKKVAHKLGRLLPDISIDQHGAGYSRHLGPRPDARYSRHRLR